MDIKNGARFRPLYGQSDIESISNSEKRSLYSTPLALKNSIFGPGGITYKISMMSTPEEARALYAVTCNELRNAKDSGVISKKEYEDWHKRLAEDLKRGTDPNVFNKISSWIATHPRSTTLGVAAIALGAGALYYRYKRRKEEEEKKLKEYRESLLQQQQAMQQMALPQATGQGVY